MPSLSSWFRARRGHRFFAAPLSVSSFRPTLESLEHRCTPTLDFTTAALVGNGVLSDKLVAVKTDSANNLVIAGMFQGTVDFDHGPGVTSLTSTGFSDVFVAKYAPDNSLLFVRQLVTVVSFSNNTVADLEIDSNDNIILVGNLRGTADFDPGTGVQTLTAGSPTDAYVWKLDANGQLIWARQLGGDASSGAFVEAAAAGLDDAGNVIVAGQFNGFQDFDPGVGEQKVLGSMDLYIAKLDATGQYGWVRTIAGTTNLMTVNNLECDALGNAVMSGWFTGTADFGAGNTMTGGVYFLARYEGDGDLSWTVRGHTFLPSVDTPTGLAVNRATGDVYYTDTLKGPFDFDPGPGEVSHTADGWEAFIWHLLADGSYGWHKILKTTTAMGLVDGNGLALDAAGNIYSTGRFANFEAGVFADFDPGPGEALLTSSGGEDIYYSKLSPDGEYLTALSLGGTLDDQGKLIAVSAVGHIYIGGRFRDTVDFDPGAGVFNLTAGIFGSDFITGLAQELTVTIDRAPGQPDITSTSPVQFQAVFSKSVADFTDSDVVLGGTAAPTTVVVSQTGPMDGTTYLLTVSGMTGDGTVTVNIPAYRATAADGSQNLAAIIIDNSVTLDTTPPAAPVFTGISEDTGVGGDGITTDATLIFSGTAEPGSTVTVTRVGVGVLGTTTAGPGGAWSFDYRSTVLPVGTHQFTATATDSAGLTGPASAPFVVTIFDPPPTVTINQAAGQKDPTNTSPILFTVVFSEPVTDFDDASDLILGGTASGTLSATITPVSATTYTVSVGGMTGNGTVTAQVAAGAAVDAGGNPNAPSTSTDNTVTYDLTVPTVTINQAAGQNDPANTGPILFTVVFSKAVTDFDDASDLILAGTVSGTLSATIMPVSATTYTVSVSGMTGNGTVTAQVAAGAAVDAAGNLSTASTSTDNTVFYDGTKPTVIIDQAASQKDSTHTGPILFTVVFNEAVTDFDDASDLILGGTASATLSATIMPVSATTYTVSVSGMTASGTVTAQVAAGAAVDAAGNLSVASTSTDNVVFFGSLIAVSSDKSPAGGPVSYVRILDTVTGLELFPRFQPYPGFRGGVRVASADVTGDGVADLITSPGKGLKGGALVKIFDGAALRSKIVMEIGPGIRPFNKSTGELFVAAGDINHDAHADIVVGNYRKGPVVKVFSGLAAMGSALAPIGPALKPFGKSYVGGARVAVGDVDGDGTLDVIAGQSKKGSKVRAYSGADLLLNAKKLLTSFKAGGAPGGGIFVAAGNVDGDARHDIIVAFGSGGSGVRIFEDSDDATTMATPLQAAPVPAYGPAFKGGARVGILDVDHDGTVEVLAVPGAGTEGQLRILDGLTLSLIDEFFAKDASFPKGLFVAGLDMAG